MQSDATEAAPGATAGHPNPQDLGPRILKQAFDLWINPEVERRRAAGTLPSDFTIDAAQIIVNIGAASVVRLNHEIKGVVRGVAARPIAKDETVTWKDLLGIERIELTTEDANAGHMTLLLFKGAWFMDFDFRYNATRIADTIARAREFLDLARVSLERGFAGPFCENLFATTELIAKATLLMLPERRVLDSKNHGFIKTEFNRWGKFGNVDGRHTSLLNRLTELRPHARYVGRPLTVTSEEMAEMLSIAEEMLSKIAAQAPKRWPTERET